MKVLVVGATGMLGQMLFAIARQQPGFDVYGTVRQKDERTLAFLRAEASRIFEYDVTTEVDPHLYCTPDIVVNCAGIIKQQGNAKADVTYIRVNSLAPHLLAEQCDRVGARLIQLSTDCVFSGRRGGYSEADLPDPVDFYGRSKLAGEVTQAPHLTIRTSFIGFERFHNLGHSLLDWFIRQKGEIKGYTRAMWSGLTSLELAHVILALIQRPDVTGLIHITSEKISKYDLLCLAQSVFGKIDVAIRPYDDYCCDRSLLSVRMADLGLRVPGVRQMLIDLHHYHERTHP
ncbi:MAG TPA: SDR family oxidoreductase [Anaerolineales bacterium]|nr:SDR family oxidoreductase [Anaerolineales bacterium]